MYAGDSSKSACQRPLSIESAHASHSFPAKIRLVLRGLLSETVARSLCALRPATLGRASALSSSLEGRLAALSAVSKWHSNQKVTLHRLVQCW